MDAAGRSGGGRSARRCRYAEDQLSRSRDDATTEAAAAAAAGARSLADFILCAPSEGLPERMLGLWCQRLRREGVPLWRASFALHSLNPNSIGAHLTWSRDDGARRVIRDLSVFDSSAYQGSPVEAIIEGEHEVLHLPLHDPKIVERFAVLGELQRDGGRDYVIYRLDNSEGLGAAVRDVFLRRHWISFATDDAGGFTPEHLELFESLRVVFSVRLALEASKQAAGDLLRAYLGPHASRRVLSGTFRRGMGESLKAVIFFSDMRGFTKFSDTRPPGEVVAALDQYFDALASPIEEEGGEVLKFIGDAVLAIFPLSLDDACGRALRALRLARANVAKLETFEMGAALHVGEVMYGNIGARGRLDFTVIGAPVNEVCRVEALTKPLGREVLLTKAFVAAAKLTDAEPLGAHELKGVDSPLQVFGLPPGS